MIKNGKFFVAPQKTQDNFKVLFLRLAAAGAGRPVDKHGFADGPWTAETLADAISSIEANHNGIELRAVQVWFQDNFNGISDMNIRWLARIFGCDDPEATSQWQAELRAAKERLAIQRRKNRKHQTNGNTVPPNVPEASAPSQTVTQIALGDLGDAERASGPPPLKWSTVMLRKTEGQDGYEETQAGRDCHEAAAG